MVPNWHFGESFPAQLSQLRTLVYSLTLIYPCLNMFRVSAKVILCSMTSDMLGRILLIMLDASTLVANACQ